MSSIPSLWTLDFAEISSRKQRKPHVKGTQSWRVCLWQIMVLQFAFDFDMFSSANLHGLANRKYRLRKQTYDLIHINCRVLYVMYTCNNENQKIFWSQPTKIICIHPAQKSTATVISKRDTFGFVETFLCDGNHDGRRLHTWINVAFTQLWMVRMDHVLFYSTHASNVETTSKYILDDY